MNVLIDLGSAVNVSIDLPWAEGSPRLCYRVLKLRVFCFALKALLWALAYGICRQRRIFSLFFFFVVCCLTRRCYRDVVEKVTTFYRTRALFLTDAPECRPSIHTAEQSLGDDHRARRSLRLITRVNCFIACAVSCGNTCSPPFVPVA